MSRYRLFWNKLSTDFSVASHAKHKKKRHARIRRKTALETLEERKLLAVDSDLLFVIPAVDEQEPITILPVASVPTGSLSKFYSQLEASDGAALTSIVQPEHGQIEPLSFDDEPSFQYVLEGEGGSSGGSGGSSGGSGGSSGGSGGSSGGSGGSSGGSGGIPKITFPTVHPSVMHDIAESGGTIGSSGGSRGSLLEIKRSSENIGSPLTITLELGGGGPGYASADDFFIGWNATQDGKDENIEFDSNGHIEVTFPAWHDTGTLYFWAKTDELIEGVEVIDFKAVENSASYTVEGEPRDLNLYDANYAATAGDQTPGNQTGMVETVPFSSCGCSYNISLQQSATIVLSFKVEIDAEFYGGDELTIEGKIGEISFKQSQSFISNGSTASPDELTFTFQFDRDEFGKEEHANYTAKLTSKPYDEGSGVSGGSGGSGGEVLYRMVESPQFANGTVYFGPEAGTVISPVAKLNLDSNGALISWGTEGGFYSDDGSGGFKSAAGTFSTLSSIVGGYQLIDKDNTVFVFDAEGYVLTE